MIEHMFDGGDAVLDTTAVAVDVFPVETDAELADAAAAAAAVYAAEAAAGGGEVLCSGLDEIPPGVLSAVLSDVDPKRLSGFDQVVLLRAHQRLVNHFQAKVYADMAAVGDTILAEDEDGDLELAAACASAEVGTALHLTRRSADFEMGFAVELVEKYPRLWKAMESGVLDLRRIRTITHNIAHLPAETARQVVDEILPVAAQLTSGQLAARLRRLCIQADPDEAQQRYEKAVAERRVIAEPTPDGTTNLSGFDLPPHLVAEITDRINQIAHHLNTKGETRTMDQLRADIYLDLLCGTHTASSSSRRGVIDIHVDLKTLAELSDTPGQLAGYGPVIADITRHHTATHPEAEWRYTITHHNQVIANGITRRRPTITQQRHTEARHPTCIFPGCRTPATRSDLDHRIPHNQGGPTTTRNLTPLCRRHHTIRHHHWTYKPQPNGTHQWTSHLQHTYTTTPHQPP